MNPNIASIAGVLVENEYRAGLWYLYDITSLLCRLGTLQALSLDAKTIKKRQVEFIDIAMDPVENYVEAEDPMKFKSTKTGRGPLQEGWQVRMIFL